MLKAAGPLQIPVYVTTQSRSRLGDTVSELTSYLAAPNVRADVDKTLFSMITPEIRALLPEAAPTSSNTSASTTTTASTSAGAAAAPSEPLDAILVGIETHICISQTTLDLLALGHRVYVLADGVSSVNPEERGVALARLRDAGAIVTTSESILFEILGDANHEAFKAISGLVKETKDETRGALGAFCTSKI